MTRATVDVTARLEQVFASAGARGFVHAREVDGAAEVGLSPDEPVVAASTFKVPVLLEAAIQMAEGRLDPTARMRVPVEGRAPGPTGISAFRDEVEMSVRDLVSSMMT
ncbi:MAG TPA: serine hydrolase, partial [Mycobacteriales bacterium]|nr:serine hydrolase [Mycobacteriales bacterium]